LVLEPIHRRGALATDGRLPKKMADDLFEAEVIWEYGRDCCDPRKAA
jgi:hypothetical protein